MRGRDCAGVGNVLRPTAARSPRPFTQLSTTHVDDRAVHARGLEVGHGVTSKAERSSSVHRKVEVPRVTVRVTVRVTARVRVTSGLGLSWLGFGYDSLRGWGAYQLAIVATPTAPPCSTPALLTRIDRDPTKVRIGVRQDAMGLALVIFQYFDLGVPHGRLQRDMPPRHHNMIHDHDHDHDSPK